MDPTPVRELGKFGIIKDAAPFDLPPNAWSGGCNVIFQSGRVTSAPICRNLTDVASVDALAEPPVHACVLSSAIGYDPIILATRDYRMRLFQSDTLTDVSPTGIAASTSAERYTSVLLGGLLYLNRVDKVPLVYDTLTSKFIALPNWDSTWRCRSIRAYKDFLIALNVTKGVQQYSTMIKWSDAVGSGTVPGNWDSTVLSSLAGENVFAEATSGIVDGLPLSNSFLVYTQTEVFSVDFIGAPLVLDFRRVFSDDGMIARNCAVEVMGKHYVFGSRDIYITDGISKKSILEGRAKNHLYNTLDSSKSGFCFAFHMPKLTSVVFAYPSLDNTAIYRGGSYCSRGLVYNYLSDTISFVDLPNVAGSAYANVQSKQVYAAVTQTYDQIGGQYSDQDDDTLRHTILTSVKATTSGITASRVVALDDVAASKVNKPSVPELLPASYVERRGLTLEGIGIHLDSRATTSSMYPLVQSLTPTKNLTVTFGRSDVPDAEPTSFNAITFDPKTMVKVDSRNTGRYLSLRFDFPTTDALYLSGYDVEVKRISRR